MAQILEKSQRQKMHTVYQNVERSWLNQYWKTSFKAKKKQCVSQEPVFRTKGCLLDEHHMNFMHSLDKL